MDDEQRAFFESLVGARIGGRYLVERLLGVGGMGLVVGARYPELEQEVAIKFMLPEHAANAVLSARFLREARLAARVKSPHFVRVFDLGRYDLSTTPDADGAVSVPYLVMELLNGQTLADELADRGPLPIGDVVDSMLEALVGLAELHALGVVHRDLKPSNLFRADAGGTSTVKVLDFGISKEHAKEGGHLTSTGNLLGTPHYMSPEQIKESKHTDARTDIWAIGVILYELLTQYLPFGDRREAPGAVFGAILYVDPEKLRTARPDLPRELEEVVLKCLRREPAERYQNVGELAAALRPFAAGHALPRIEAIRKALSSPQPRASDNPTPDPAPPRASAASTKRGSPVARVGAAEISGEAPTVASDPRGSAAAVEPVAARAVSGPATLGAQTSNTPVRAPVRSRRGWLFAIAAIAVGGGVGAVLAWKGGGTTTPAVSAPDGTKATIAAAGAGTPTTSAQTNVKAPEPTAVETTATRVATVASAPATSAPAASATTRPVVGAGTKRGPATGHPPAGATTAPATTKGSLLDDLDRK